MKLASRINRFQEEIFTLVDQKRQAVEKSGKRIFNMSIGTPDFEPATALKEAMKEAVEEPNAWKYSLYDLPELKQAVKTYYETQYGVSPETEHIISVSGTQTGLSYVFLACCDPGDVVLLPDPCYPGFQNAADIAEVKVQYYPLLREHHFLPDLSAIEEELAKAAKLMIINFPNNPTGAVADAAFYRELIRWAKQYDVLIVSDQAYGSIVFDGKEHMSFLAVEGVEDVGVELLSMSKSFNVTGARIGFLTGRKDVVNAVRILRDSVDIGMFRPLQRTAIAALTAPGRLAEEQREEYEKRRNVLCRELGAIGWEVECPAGGLFVWASLPPGYKDSRAFAFELMEQTGVICMPGSAFGPHGEGYVRFALVMPEHEIREAVQAIAASGILRKPE